MNPRLLLAVLLALTAACTGPTDPDSRTPSPGTTEDGPPPVVSERFTRVACRLPPVQLLRVWRGYHPERSGQIQIIPRPKNYFGNFSHSGPWPYLQRTPLFFYGPGQVPASGSVSRFATVADIAPTFGALVGFPFEAPDGRVLEEAIEPDSSPPRLVLLMVWDSAGINVLEEHPDAWPTLRGLMPEGVWFDEATVGSSPSVTPAVHTTIGTGAFPRTHGVMDLRYELDGELRSAREFGPSTVLSPSLADEYDLAGDNRPVIGMVGSTGVLGMIGRGARIDGADRDLAVTQKNGAWGAGKGHEQAYRFPDYFEEIGGLEEALRDMDLEDGRLDQRWLGEEIPHDRTATPAMGPYVTNIIDRVIREEGFGADDVPDLLFVNYKMIDHVGHLWGMNSPQMEAVVRATDEALGDLIAILDREVGEGEWALAVTSDHGSTPRADLTGSFAIDIGELEEDLQARFDTDGDDRSAIRSARVTQIWLDEGELGEAGYTQDDVAGFLLRYTRGDNDPAAARPDERVFEAAIPGPVLESDLPCLNREGTG